MPTPDSSPPPPQIDVAALREEYTLRHLRRRDLDPDPIAQFNRWFGEAIQAQVRAPNAMSLATVNAAGQPSVRIVLLKGVAPDGFLFFTNYGSRKAMDIKFNARAALNLFWAELERQVAIEGTVRKATREESDNYFHTRPVASQLGAWASHQSQIVPSRKFIEEKLDTVTAEYAGKTVPLPPFWGGYWLEPASIELWQGGPGRIHDRLRYTRSGDTWKIDRLSP